MSDTAEITPYEQAYQKLKHLNVVYEDDQILVVDKPAGILSQKQNRRRSASMNG